MNIFLTLPLHLFPPVWLTPHGNKKIKPKRRRRISYVQRSSATIRNRAIEIVSAPPFRARGRQGTCDPTRENYWSSGCLVVSLVTSRRSKSTRFSPGDFLSSVSPLRIEGGDRASSSTKNFLVSWWMAFRNFGFGTRTPFESVWWLCIRSVVGGKVINVIVRNGS